MTIKTHIPGDHRFDGYGNVEVDPQRHLRGWQLTCSECGARSEIQAHKGRSYPPKMLYRWFREKGWKLSGNPAHDVCPACLERTRQRHREERKQYINGSADRLIEGIRLVDQLMTASVTAEYGARQPDVAAAMRSLIETAYLCNMLKREDIPEDIRPSTPPEPAREPISQEEVPSHIASMPTHAPLPENTQPAAIVEVEVEPPPPPPPPEHKPEPIHPRTAAYLAEMRRTILGQGAH